MSNINNDEFIEPILDPRNAKFTIFPIKYHKIWARYKEQLASMWKAEEIDFSNDYEKRKALLQKNKVALWDVLQFCDRIGSLDSAIKNEIANDFETFLEQHPNIKTILFNGQKAAAFFKKYVQLKKHYEFIILPSTSPANASQTYQSKLQQWKIISSLQ